MRSGDPTRRYTKVYTCICVVNGDRYNNIRWVAHLISVDAERCICLIGYTMASTFNAPAHPLYAKFKYGKTNINKNMLRLRHWITEFPQTIVHAHTPLTAHNFTTKEWPLNRMNFNVSWVSISIEMEWRTQQIGQGNLMENQILFYHLVPFYSFCVRRTAYAINMWVFHFERGSFFFSFCCCCYCCCRNWNREYVVTAS